MLAALVTFPLSFGWIRFETVPHSQQMYQAFVFGVPVFRFPLGSPLAPLVFNILDIAAVLVLLGIGVAMWRRARHQLRILSGAVTPSARLSYAERERSPPTTVRSAGCYSGLKPEDRQAADRRPAESRPTS